MASAVTANGRGLNAGSSAVLKWKGRRYDVEIAQITPADAEEMLTRNIRNRPLSQRAVKRLARIMDGGGWVLNGEAIIFDDEGNLLNGQHRLTACIESGKSFETVIIRGILPDGFDTLDVGRRRCGADVLAMLGHPQSFSLAGAAQIQYRLEHNCLNTTSAAAENSEVREIIEQHPGLVEAIPMGRALVKLCAPSIATFCAYQFTQRDPEAARKFFDGLITGVDLADGDPVLLLRNRLLDNKVAKAKLPQPEVLALFIKAWKHHVAGQKIRYLRWRNTPPAPEPFPSLD